MLSHEKLNRFSFKFVWLHWFCANFMEWMTAFKMADKISRKLAALCMLRSSHFHLYSLVMYMAEVCSLRDPPEQDSHSHLLVSHLTQSHTWHLIMQVSRKQHCFQIYFYFRTAVYFSFSLKANKQKKQAKRFILSDVFVKCCKITKVKMFQLVLLNVNVIAASTVYP